jgi:hypothetical protein
MIDNKVYKAYLKSPYRSIKHSTYFDIYEKIFTPYVGKEIIFIEIGVLNGGSLFMWREFFGPHARIIGVDLNPEAKRWSKEGFEIHIGSQSDPLFWKKVIEEIGYIDVVLDDGGHTYEQQIITTECLLPHIKDGGMLVVEDTHTSYMDGFGPKSRSFMKYAINMVHRINKRFWRLATESTEERVLGIRFYDSFVIFDVDRKATSVKSESVDNGGKDLGARDYRYVDNSITANVFDRICKLSFMMKLQRYKILMKQTESLAYVFSYIKNYYKLRKYFI